MIDRPFNKTDKQVYPFDVEDEFNPGNRLQGYICIAADLKYGMLYIEKVNGKKCPQWIWATPKMHYPFNRNRIFRYPADITSIEGYAKYDGTNVLAYCYIDKDFKRYVTYKSRKTPVIKDSVHRQYASMWKEMILKYPKIPQMVLDTGDSLSFEMYGLRNKHLIVYEISLDAKFLFGRDANGVIKTPSAYDLDRYGIIGAELINTIDDVSDFVGEYTKVTDQLNEQLRVEKQDDEEFIYGMEGSIWYALSRDKNILFKCKPDHVRDIHFAEWDGIPDHSIYITCLNSFEDKDDPKIEYIIELLKEEFTEDAINKKMPKISKIFNEVWNKMRLMKELRDEYHRHPEFDINKDKSAVMQHFSKIYPKNRMKMIYTLLMEEFGK